MQQRALEFLIRYKEYVTAILLIFVCAILIATGSNAKLRTFRTISVGIVATVQSAFSWLPNPYAVQAENRSLRQLNKDMSLQIMQLRDAGMKVEQLRNMLGLKQRAPMKLLTAEVIGKLRIQLRNYATINAGTKDGVQIGMPVITDQGLVGRVIGCTGNNAIVQLLLNGDLRVAARTLAGRNDGMIVWNGTSTLTLKNVPSSLHQRKGDSVLTSLYSTLFPPNLVIGTITEIKDDPQSLFSLITVTPSVSFSTLEEVFVVLSTPNLERQQLESSVMKDQPQPTKGSTE